MTRLDRQIAVERVISEFNPDFTEAQELLDALIGSLGNRYRSDLLMVVQEEAAALRIALGEAEPYRPSEEDLAYDDHVQRELDETA